MIRHIAICDDEAAMRDDLRERIGCFCAERGDEADIRCYASGDELLRELDPGTGIILLDIGMAGTDGMEAARALRRRGCNALLLFITGMTGYALDGYSVHAFAFLPKPVTDDCLRRQLGEAFAEADSRPGLTMSLNTAQGKVIVDPGRVLYA